MPDVLESKLILVSKDHVTMWFQVRPWSIALLTPDACQDQIPIKQPIPIRCYATPKTRSSICVKNNFFLSRSHKTCEHNIVSYYSTCKATVLFFPGFFLLLQCINNILLSYYCAFHALVFPSENANQVTLIGHMGESLWEKLEKKTQLKCHLQDLHDKV